VKFNLKLDLGEYSKEDTVDFSAFEDYGTLSSEDSEESTAYSLDVQGESVEEMGSKIKKISEVLKNDSSAIKLRVKSRKDLEEKLRAYEEAYAIEAKALVEDDFELLMLEETNLTASANEPTLATEPNSSTPKPTKNNTSSASPMQTENAEAENSKVVGSGLSSKAQKKIEKAGNNGFAVQIGVYRNPKNFDTKPIENYGEVVKERRNRLTYFYLIPARNTYIKCVDARNDLRTKNLVPDAFVREFPVQ
jgi:hypothetical protein